MPAYNRNKINSGILRYPLDAFEEDTDYLRINTVDYIPPGSKEESFEISYDRRAIVNGGQQPRVTSSTRDKKTKITLSENYKRGKENRYRNTEDTKKEYKSKEGTIFLPIPSNIQDGNSVKYTEGELDGLTAEVLGFVTKTMKGGAKIDSLTDVGKLVSDFLKNGTDLLSNKDFAAHFTRSLAAQAANIPFGGNLTASQLLARQNGSIINPNMELLFDGVTIRSFKFSFKMTPRGKDEMEHVKSIIRHFKKSMTPSNNEDVYLSTPKIFELSYMKGNGPHPFLHKFKPCALTDCSVNYTGEANYATYQDGTPVSMVMDLGFKELEPIYNDDYESDQGKGGVGY
jgi:hypothetical protein